MVHYLIEFRFHGKAKYKIKNLIGVVNKKFRTKIKRVVPHITLVGPFYTRDENKLIKYFNRLCSKKPLMGFVVGGFYTFEDNRVVFLGVDPSNELNEFRWELSRTLQPFCKLGVFDYERKFKFHITVVMKESDDKFSKIKDYIERTPDLNFKHVVVRATLLKGGIILREYDFLLQRPLTRNLAKNKKIYSQTMTLLKSHFETRFNCLTGSV